MAVLVGCGASEAPARHSRAAPQAESYVGPLTALLPEGASAVIVARPNEIYASQALSRVALSIIAEERLETYAIHTGIDPRRLTELVYATYGSEVVLLVRGPFNAPFAVREMAARMLPVESEADVPFMRRSGHYQGARRDLIALSSDTLLAVSGTPMTAGQIVTRARASRRTPGAADRPHVSSLLAAHGAAPFVFILPRPLGLPRGAGVGLLLAREEAMAVSASGAEDDVLLFFDLRGEFPPGASDNFRALVTSLAESDMGAALGMREALPTLAVDADQHRAAIRAQVQAGSVAAGLDLLFHAEIEDAVGGAPADGPPDAP